jgi:crotonobetainyl-CoA:carnitine CoA-transferase CaiB-like acyl-CoA transferase
MGDLLASVLTGMRIVEWCSGIAGPLAGRRLRDFGATVTRLELPDEQDWLQAAGACLSPSVDSVVFEALNAGKQCVSMGTDWRNNKDLENELSSADIVITDKTREQVDAAGLRLLRSDVEAGVSPVIWVSVTPHGPRGPWARMPGSELTVEASTGYMGYIGIEPGASRLGNYVGEIGTGIFATQAALAAIYAKAERSAGGQWIDVSVMQSLLSMASIQVAAHADPDDFLGPRIRGEFYPPQRGWRCSDGQITFAFGGAVGKSGRPGWVNFVQEIGAGWMLEDERFDEFGLDTTGLGIRVEETREAYEDAFSSYTCDELVRLIREYGGSAARFQTLPEALNHPQVHKLGLVHDAANTGASVTRIPGIRVLGRPPQSDCAREGMTGKEGIEHD